MSAHSLSIGASDNAAIAGAEALLFPAFVSSGAETLAPLWIGAPLGMARTESAIVADAPSASVPRMQVMFLVPLQKPRDGVAPINSTPASSVSVTTTSVAGAGRRW